MTMGVSALPDPHHGDFRIDDDDDDDDDTDPCDGDGDGRTIAALTEEAAPRLYPPRRIRALGRPRGVNRRPRRHRVAVDLAFVRR